MFNIGFFELVILAVIGIIVVGPEQLPGLARKIAKILNELKRARDEIMSPVDELRQETMKAVDKIRTESENFKAKVNSEINKKASEFVNPSEPKLHSDSLDEKMDQNGISGHEENPELEKKKEDHES